MRNRALPLHDKLVQIHHDPGHGDQRGDRPPPSTLRCVLLGGAAASPPLLDRAFEVARCGTVAEQATLEIRNSTLVITCRQCGNENEAEANRLLCKACGGWQVNVKQGDEMLLLRVELSGIDL